MATCFEDLLIWKQAKDISIIVYSIFKDNKDFGFKDQIQRASISVMNNIAEGYDRESEKEKYRFFSIAKGSCAEVRSMLHIGLSLGYIDEIKYNDLNKKCFGLSKMLYGFMQKFNFK